MVNLTLYHGDALKILPKLPDESVDLVITDPPYGISQPNRKINRFQFRVKSLKSRSAITLDFGKWDWFSSDEEYFNFTEMWFKEVARILKPKSWIYIFFPKQKVGYLDLYLAKKYDIKARTIIVWHKTNPTPQIGKVNWLSSTEFIWVGSKGNCKIKNFLAMNEMHNFIETPNANSYGVTNHTTEKPVSIIKKLILTSSNIGETVLDPFLGSGTTMQACLELHRNCIGIELNKKYIDMIKNRLHWGSTLGNVEFRFIDETEREK